MKYDSLNETNRLQVKQTKNTTTFAHTAPFSFQTESQISQLLLLVYLKLISNPF